MHIHHAGNLGDVFAHVREIYVARSCLEQDVRHIAEQPPHPGAIIAAITSEAMTSARSKSVVAITTPATMTASEPSRSPSTSR